VVTNPACALIARVPSSIRTRTSPPGPLATSIRVLTAPMLCVCGSCELR
jgi:hypothetical protein